MKAIGFRTSLKIDQADSFIEFEKEIPTATGRDILVKVEAISVNPVDYKVRNNSLKDKQQDNPKVIGWDAVGTVEATGDEVELFKKGDLVFYAGDLTRDGSNQEFQLVDERVVGFAPKHLSIEQAAAMPLTSLTAYEILFERLLLNKEKDNGKTILIIGGAGGVGSICIQLAKKLLGLTVIATASRSETIDWCMKMGADHVVNHNNLINNINSIGYKEVDYILDFVDLNQYWDPIVELIKPQGKVGSISDPTGPVHLNQLKRKSASFYWELMFTRSMYQTDDLINQHNILNRIAKLLDDGIAESTLYTTMKGFSVENIKEAHRLLESGKAIGKIVVKF